MTCAYTHMNPLDALYVTACDYPGGLEALAQRMGKSAHVLRNKLRPAIDTHHTSLQEFSLLLDFLAEARMPNADLPLQALCWRHGYVPVPLPEGTADGDGIYRQMLAKLREDGELAADIERAMGDDKIDAKELDRIERSAMESLVAHLVLLEQIRAKARADAARSNGREV
ncbi:hypothetical protein SAMN02949497_3540 [Methylomagnum ishizawai]|uniref:Phage regulatory protein CII (CP76) n=1 Tax=Methylomagnum ishizawai TaxID=1760988 RepID=A0A1Y6D8P4_9GAMM|nr:phage regulatory CII family protein [Methylomagnum ishizawai]SMF96155.1 hypothetical protein SAMN02949497_3540 [Methylomagnum ishizawai]